VYQSIYDMLFEQDSYHSNKHPILAVNHMGSARSALSRVGALLSRGIAISSFKVWP
jgi:hypothetical protein